MNRLVKFFLYSLLLVPVMTKAATITIGGTSYTINTVETLNVADGVSYYRYDVPDYPLKFSILKIDCRKDKLKIDAWSAKDYVRGVETPLAFSTRKTGSDYEILGVINGDLGSFATNVLCAAEMINGELTQLVVTTDICPSPDNGAPCAPHVGIDKYGKPVIDIMRFKPQVKLMNGMDYTVSGVNIKPDGTMLARGTDQLIIYNGYVDKDSTATNEWGVEYLVAPVNGWTPADNGDILVKVEKIRPMYDGENAAVALPKMPVVKGKAVLSGHGAARTFLRSLAVGDQLYINWGATLDDNPSLKSLTQVVGGSDIILKNGLALDPFTSYYCGQTVANPRTAAGCTNDGNFFFMAAVDGRQTGMAGVTTKRLGDIMKFAGADVAINLDGGGSTCMVVNGAVKNSPSENRAIFNGLLVARVPVTALDVITTNGENISVYPNPVEKTVFFKLSPAGHVKNLKIMLYDLNGKEVKTVCRNEQLMPGDFRIFSSDTGQLAPGTYVYEVTGDIRSYTGKLIVK